MNRPRSALQRRSVLAAFVALAALALPSGARAHERPLSATLRSADAKIDWTNLRRDERMRVLRRWGRAPRAFDDLVARIADRLANRRSSSTELAEGNHTDQEIGGAGA